MISLEINDKFKELKRSGVINRFYDYGDFFEIEFANASKERLERIVEFLNGELDRKVKIIIKNPKKYKKLTKFF